MNFGKKTLAVTIACAMGSAIPLTPASASSVLADGNWALTIVPTPTGSTSYGGYTYTYYKFGTDGNWNSGFSYGGIPSPSAQGMTDNGVLVRGTGSSIGGDGFAGIIEMNVLGGSFSVPGTNMAGTVDGAGNMTFDPTGRLGSYSLFPALTSLPFYIDDANCDTNGCTSNGNTAWTTFSTGTATTPSGTIHGTALTDAGDLDGDGIADYQGVLVSGGQIGSQWGLFFGTAYY